MCSSDLLSIRHFGSPPAADVSLGSSLTHTRLGARPKHARARTHTHTHTHINSPLSELVCTEPKQNLIGVVLLPAVQVCVCVCVFVLVSQALVVSEAEAPQPLRLRGS